MIEGAWVCNECGSPEFTGAVGEADFDDDALSCTDCGGTEFHWEKPTDNSPPPKMNEQGQV
jgi:hypothetical protein